MATLTMKELLEAGVHFGHQTKRWNPKMQKYIFGERNGIYIIDLQKTLKKFREAYAFVRDLAADGGIVLFVGTKKQAQETVLEETTRCGMFYVNHRWLGGTLTNFATIRKSIARLKKLDEMSETGEYPCSSAAANNSGLNAEPGCRRLRLARLNCDCAKSRPPTSARRLPVRGSIATSAAWSAGSPNRASPLRTTCSAASCSAGTKVVRTSQSGG